MTVVDRGSVPPRTSAEAWLRVRIMEIVARGGDPRGRTPGIIAWYQLRHELGGRFRTAEVRGAVERFLQEGELIEVWYIAHPRWVACHRLVFPSLLGQLPKVWRARGTPELVRAALGR